MEAVTETARALTPLAALVPLGVSPFLALGLLGLASHYLDYALPAGLGVLSHPIIWGGLLALFVLLYLGRSFKLTKPLAEVAGTTEFLVALVAFAAIFLTSEGGAGVAAAAAQASVFGSAILFTAAFSGLLAVTFVRVGIDFLTWISPIPFIDALLQLAKTALTAALVGLAVFLPGVAVVANILLLIVIVLGARWLIRAAGFLIAVLWDRVFGWTTPVTVEMADGRLGPLRIWSMSGKGELSLFAMVEVEWSPTTGWILIGKEEDGVGRHISLGSSLETTLSRSLVGTTLETPRGSFLFTARYGKEAIRRVSEVTGTPVRSGVAPGTTRAEAG